jgi:hypothetical protein
MPTVAVLPTTQAVDQLDHPEHVVAGALQLFAVREQWATAVLLQVVAASAVNNGPKFGTLVAVNVLVQILTVTLVDANTSKVLILPVHLAAVAVMEVFHASAEVGKVFANTTIGWAAKVAPAVAIFHTQIHRPMYGI